MKRLIVIAIWCVAAYAFAQTCILPAPSAPPRLREVHVEFNPDGGCRPCFLKAFTDNGATPQPYALSNAKCDQACAFGRQAVAKDNGWDDGGTP